MSVAREFYPYPPTYHKLLCSFQEPKLSQLKIAFARNIPPVTQAPLEIYDRFLIVF